MVRWSGSRRTIDRRPTASSQGEANMKRAALFSAVILLLLAVRLSALQGSQGGKAGQSASTQQTIRGCLSGSGSLFTLTDDSGRAWELEASTDTLNMLKERVGNEVAITGTPSSAGDSAASSTAGSTTSPPNRSTLHVSSLQYLADTCTATGGAAPGPGGVSGTAEQPNAIQGSAAGEASQNNAASSAETPPPVTNQTPARPTRPADNETSGQNPPMNQIPPDSVPPSIPQR